MVTNADDISKFLNLLDGTDSWDRCLTLATTNYPEELPGNIVDRPSRFDRLYRIDNPSEPVRRIYLEAKLGKELVTDELIRLTKGYSVAYLKDIAASLPIFRKDPIQTVKEYEERKRLVKKEFAEHKRVGFGSDDD